jgi:energy-coupling factor transporter ATP-binding protein EcfA2
MTGFEMILPFLRPIQAHILDPDVSEIMVNGPEQVFVERAGYLEQIEGVTLNEKSLMVAVKNIARRLGDDISEEKPILDSRLPDGSRVAAVIPPCSLNGVTLTIRKFNARHFGIEDLIRIGTITENLAAQFENAVRSRKNILISGGTGTGKTTLLNIVANFIPDGERVLVIEDTAEIQIRTPNLVRFEARRAQDELPAVTIRDLLKAKYQVIWRVEGFGPDEAESALRSLAQRFGGDPAATDSTRVFRLPGFSNKKYEQDFQVTIRSEAPPNLVYRPEDFRVPSLDRDQSPQTSPAPREPVRTNGGNHTQSEKDLAYAIRHLKAGDDPDDIIRAIAGYRSVDQYDKRNPTKLVAHKKPKPRYYAELTVTKAMATLGITRPAQPKPPATPDKFGGEAELEPNR